MGPGNDQFELLRRYARERDEGAFALLVRQYVDLVYSSALRRVGNRHMAEDVTQAVFVILARKAASLLRERSLAGWLLQTVRYAAANAIKMEARRRVHERKAGEAMKGALCSPDPTEVLVWGEIAPRLDDAVLKLPAADRTAIMMRFFEGRNTRDLAEVLGVSEDAAKMRLSRAVSKLRRKLAVDDATLPAAAFTALLAGLAVQSAPASVAAMASTAAVGTATTGAGLAIAKGALTMMTWSKTKACAAALALAAMVGTGGFLAVQQAVAQAQPKPVKAQAQADKAPDPQGVVAKAAPVVIKTVPEAGSTDVDPGLREIKVTFSKEMQDGNWSWVQMSKETFPQTVGKPHYLDDKRTCVLTVKLEPGKGYILWINHAPFDAFMDTDHRKAVPYLLTFETAK